jgi:hypothetical protein
MLSVLIYDFNIIHLPWDLDALHMTNHNRNIAHIIQQPKLTAINNNNNNNNNKPVPSATQSPNPFTLLLFLSHSP